MMCVHMSATPFFNVCIHREIDDWHFPFFSLSVFFRFSFFICHELRHLLSLCPSISMCLNNVKRPNYNDACNSHSHKRDISNCFFVMLLPGSFFVCVCASVAFYPFHARLCAVGKCDCVSLKNATVQ